MQLCLTARPECHAGGGAVVALADRDAALLAWLALEGPTPRGRLSSLFWPERNADAARNSLRQRLFHLRRLVGADVVTGSAVLALADGVQHDLGDASSLLPTLATPIGAEFDAWLEHRREALRQRQREVLRQRCDAAEAAGDWPAALALAREASAREPLSEEAHRRLMRLHYLAGDRAAALLAFDRCEQLLKHEVGVQPSPETLALLATIERAEALQGERALVVAGTVPAAVLRPPRLVGRDRELALMHEGWRAHQVVALIGEAGMGKSRLLQAFGGAEPGLAGAAARPGDASVPLSTLARLAFALSGREIGTLASQGAAAVLGALRALLAERGAAGGVFVDDLHFADVASLDLLRGLVDGADGLPLRWILAYRPAEAGSALAALHESLDEGARLRAVAIEPLDEAALAELVDSLGLPGVRGAALAAGLRRRAGGNPLFALETLKQAWVEQSLASLAENLPRASSVMRLIARRLTQLSPGALMLARCAAIAGTAFSPTLAAQVLGVHPLALADAWAELERAQILRDQAFCHDLYHEAAEASVPAAIARHLHASVAGHLEASATAPAALLAHHWLAAGDPRRALPHLEAAAAAARDALDPASAASFHAQLADAREATGDAARAFDAAQDAVTARRALGADEAMESAVDRLQSLARTPRQRAQAFEARGVMHHMRGESAQAAHWVAQGLDALGPDADAVARIVLLNLHGIVLRRANRLPAAREALEEALALARGAPPGSVDDHLPAVLNNLALALQEMDEHLAASGLLQESAGLQSDPLVRARVLNNLGTSLEERGQASLAYEQRLAAARLCGAAKTEGTSNLMLAISLGATARALARFREAMAHLTHAGELAARIRHFRLEDLHRQWTALWLELGRPNQAREALEAAEATGEAHPAHLALLRMSYLAAIGQDARPLIERSEAAIDRSDARTWRRFRLAQAQVLDPEQALPMLQEMLAQPNLRDHAGLMIPAQVRMAQTLARLGRHREALRFAQRAADALDVAQPVELSVAEVWWTLAQAAQQAGDLYAARAAAATGRRWLDVVAATQLDAPLREAYLQRNRVNLALRLLAAQLGVGEGDAAAPPATIG